MNIKPRAFAPGSVFAAVGVDANAADGAAAAAAGGSAVVDALSTTSFKGNAARFEACGCAVGHGGDTICVSVSVRST